MAGNGLTAVTMPKWGLSMKEGRLVTWGVPEGAKISKGDEIAEVETEKIASAVEAPVQGVLRKIVAEPDQVYPVGSLLGVIAAEEISDVEVTAFVEKFQAEFVPPEDDEGDDEAKPEFLEAGGCRLRYLSKGEGEDVILLIHGFGGDLENWMFNHDELAANSGARVIALDLPGHGQSSKKLQGGSVSDMAGAVLAFLDALGVQQAHLVGHSMGGAIALAMAKARPSLSRSLALVASAGLGSEINTEYIEGFISSRSRKEIKPVLQHLFADEELVTRQMVNNILQYKRLDGVSEALRTIADAFIQGGGQADGFNDVLISIDVPRVVFWGRQDQVIPADHAEKCPEGVEVEIFEGAGHMVQMEEAGDLNKRILSLVKNCEN